MIKTLRSFVLVSAFLSSAFGGVAAGDNGDNKGGGNFVGAITAIEESRDSITVLNDAGRVKMFAVTPEKKAHLTVGQRVSIAYTDTYYWPLHTRSVEASDK